MNLDSVKKTKARFKKIEPQFIETIYLLLLLYFEPVFLYAFVKLNKDKKGL